MFISSSKTSALQSGRNRVEYASGISCIFLINRAFCSIYDKGCNRTGCMFCCFGIHLEQSPNKFELMRITHPKLYDYCMENLEIKNVLNYMNEHLKKKILF